MTDHALECSRPEKLCVLVTGGAGFIGAAFCRHLMARGRYRVVNVDKLTYAANPRALAPIEGQGDYRFIRCDISDPIIADVLREEQVDHIVHLAAETHVDRSIASPAEFIETNINGTYRLLDAATRYWQALPGRRRDLFRFHLVSTDEVFGDVGYDEEILTSDLRYQPSSPYSASKAAAEHLANAWRRTYGLPVSISNSSNNYGPFQLPDKLIPRMVLNALHDQPLPIYGSGLNVRNWLYVEDHARALELVLTAGRPGGSYHIGTRAARSNIEVVEAICGLLDGWRPRQNGKLYSELITFVADRPGHDRRYAMDPGPAQTELGWSPTQTFEAGLEATVRWYLDEWIAAEPRKWTSTAPAAMMR